jgi:hypothetical protein
MNDVSTQLQKAIQSNTLPVACDSKSVGKYDNERIPLATCSRWDRVLAYRVRCTWYGGMQSTHGFADYKSADAFAKEKEKNQVNPQISVLVEQDWYFEQYANKTYERFDEKRVAELHLVCLTYRAEPEGEERESTRKRRSNAW